MGGHAAAVHTIFVHHGGTATAHIHFRAAEVSFSPGETCEATLQHFVFLVRKGRSPGARGGEVGSEETCRRLTGSGWQFRPSITVGCGLDFCHRFRVDVPSDYAEVWKKRYAELLSHGVPDERAKELASELAAAAVLTLSRSRQGEPPIAQSAASPTPVPVLKMAKFDGYGLLVMGVPSIIIALFSSSVSGFLIGAVVTVCGWCELDGYRRYTGRLTGARLRLMGSQILLIVTAWAYAGWTLLHPEPLSPEIADLIKESGDQASDIQSMMGSLRLWIAAAICGVTLLYQGSLSLYYWSKTRGLK